RIAFSAVLGFVSFAFWNLSTVAAQDLADPSVFGSVTGVVQNMAFACAAVAPVISGTLIVYMGLSYALAVSMCIPYLVHGLVFASLSIRRSMQVETEE
ncbi:MAG: hypothetical protein GTN80_01485, partial [Nitrososphaeria archaeon]|nr:hypothetical protein [Nitrososphaeria archaeon]